MLLLARVSVASHWQPEEGVRQGCNTVWGRSLEFAFGFVTFGSDSSGTTKFGAASAFGCTDDLKHPRSEPGHPPALLKLRKLAGCGRRP